MAFAPIGHVVDKVIDKSVEFMPVTFDNRFCSFREIPNLSNVFNNSGLNT